MVEHNFPREPFVECFEKHVKDPDQQVDSVTVMCIHRCYYDAIGMFSGGKLVADKYRQYRDTLEPDLHEAFSWAMKFCAAFVTKAIGATAELKSLRCNPVPYLYNRCLSEAGLVNCPASHWMNSSLCTELVQKLKAKYGTKIQLPTAA
uniref:Uncharacterized protein n=1 Tax=Anopheles atroparvus TaxID=41427 RepID=A0A182JCE6_ANOAO